MTPPKKAFFSLNVDSQIESLPPPSVTHHDTQDSFGKKVVQVSGPVTGSSKIEIVKEKEGKTSKHVENYGIEPHNDEKENQDSKSGLEGTGTKEHLTYTTESSTTSTTKDGPTVHTSITKKDTQPLDHVYDTSEL